MGPSGKTHRSPGGATGSGGPDHSPLAAAEMINAPDAPTAEQLLNLWREAERALETVERGDRESLEATVAEAARAYRERFEELSRQANDGPPSPPA